MGLIDTADRDGRVQVCPTRPPIDPAVALFVVYPMILYMVGLLFVYRLYSSLLGVFLGGEKNSR